MREDTLLTYPYVFVRLRCDLCNRRGAYRLVRPVLKFGPDITLDDLLRRLTADCAGRERGKRWGDGCKACYPDLEPPVRPPDMPPSDRGGEVVGCLVAVTCVRLPEVVLHALGAVFDGGVAAAHLHKFGLGELVELGAEIVLQHVNRDADLAERGQGLPDAVCEGNGRVTGKSSLHLLQRCLLHVHRDYPKDAAPQIAGADVLLRLLTRRKTNGLLIMHGNRSIRRWETAWRNARTRAKLDNAVNPYSIRHSVARWMRSQGVSPWEVANQLGHSVGARLSTTEIYAPHAPDYLADACVAIGRLMREVAACQSRIAA